MRIEVITAGGKRLEAPFLLRLSGWTEEEYFAKAPENQFWEFKEGELIIHSPASSEHQRIVRFLTVLLSSFVEKKGLGEVFNGPAVLRLREGVDKEPDIFFISQDHLESVKELYIEGPAELVIEVASPSTRIYDLEEKAGVYKKEGIKEYWVVDPEQKQVTLFGSKGVEVRQEGKLFSQVIPGFWVEVGWLWQRPLPSTPSCLEKILSTSG